MALMVANQDWSADDDALLRAVAERLQVDPADVVSILVVKKSLDARHLKQVYRAVCKVEVRDQERVVARSLPGIHLWTDRHDGRYGLSDQGPKKRPWPEGVRPIVVGAGPAGLFAALYLAETGAEVRLFDRGGPIEDRVPAVNGHWRRKLPLDPENNVLFGEGGAGTFSDGKIYTRRRDGDLGYIFRRLVDFGAGEEILSEAFAHLGTDKVRAILPPFRARLAELGVDVRFHTRVDDLIVEDGEAVGVVLSDGTEVRGGPVIVAVGHSARDTAEMRVRRGVAAEARPMAIGARIEHPQTVIDAGRYGGADRGDLPAASYRLSHNPENGRAAHTFCMCPGGLVVPASAQENRVVVNGMSFAARRAFWANSAVIVEVTPEDYPHDGPLAGFDFQDAIEALAWELTEGTERAPAQRVEDLLAGRPSTEIPRTSFPLGVTPVDLRDLLPPSIVEGMISAILAFDRKVPGFAGAEAVLIAPETRTTSPVRYLRGDDQQSVSIRGLYPAGEGAGYGGGIISSALDGFRAARFVTEAHTED